MKWQGRTTSRHNRPPGQPAEKHMQNLIMVKESPPKNFCLQQSCLQNCQSKWECIMWELVGPKSSSGWNQQRPSDQELHEEEEFVPCLFSTGSPWVTTAIGTGIAVPKQCGCKTWCHATTSLGNSNPTILVAIIIPRLCGVLSGMRWGVSGKELRGAAQMLWGQVVDWPWVSTACLSGHTRQKIGGLGGCHHNFELSLNKWLCWGLENAVLPCLVCVHVCVYACACARTHIHTHKDMISLF